MDSVCEKCLRTIHTRALHRSIHITKPFVTRPLSSTSHTYLQVDPTPKKSKNPAGRGSNLSTAYASQRAKASPSPQKPSNLSRATPTSKTKEPTGNPSSEGPKTPVGGLAEAIRNAAPSWTETYVAYGVCETLVKECIKTADYELPQRQGESSTEVPKLVNGEEVGVGKGWWYQTLGLKPTFNTWAQITFLHMWFLTVRFRSFPPSHAPAWHQHLINHFSYIAEDRMTRLHAIDVRSARNKYLKDLFNQWRGAITAYDEGLIRGDPVLATALWRNIWGASDDVDFVGLAMVVSYTRSVLKELEKLPDEAIGKGDIVFGDPEGERNRVMKRSPSLRQDQASDTDEGSRTAVGGTST